MTITTTERSASRREGPDRDPLAGAQSFENDETMLHDLIADVRKTAGAGTRALADAVSRERLADVVSRLQRHHASRLAAALAYGLAATDLEALALRLERAALLLDGARLR